MEYYTIREICESFLQQNKDKFPNVIVDEMLRTNFYACGHNKISDVSIIEAMYDDKNYELIAYYLLSADCANFIGNSDMTDTMDFLKQYMTDEHCFKYNINEEGIWLDVYHYNKPTLTDIVKRFDSVLTSYANDIMRNKRPKNRKEEILEQIRSLTKELEEL